MLKMANLMTDTALLEEAKTAAAALLEEDPTLTRPENRAFSVEVARLLEAAVI